MDRRYLIPWRDGIKDNTVLLYYLCRPPMHYNNQEMEEEIV